MLFWVLMKRLLKKRSPRLVYGSSSSKGWLCMCDSMLAKRQNWKMFLGSLAKLGNCCNSPIRRKSSLELDVIWTRNFLIWSQTRYYWATKSFNSQLHNRDLWIFVILLAARCHFGLIKNLSRNNHFDPQPSRWLSWCALASEKEIKAHYFSAIFLTKSWKFKCDNSSIFWVLIKSLLKTVLLGWFTGLQVQKVDCVFVIRCLQNVILEKSSWVFKRNWATAVTDQ